MKGGYKHLSVENKTEHNVVEPTDSSKEKDVTEENYQSILYSDTFNPYNSYKNKPYEFSDYPSTFKPYQMADIKFEDNFALKDNPNYWNDWGSIFANADSADYDFAGKYKLITAGNGTMRNVYVVDGYSGRIYSDENVIATGPSTFLFKSNSRLMVIVMDNSHNFVPETNKREVYFYYLLQESGILKLLGMYTYENNMFAKMEPKLVF